MYTPEGYYSFHDLRELAPKWTDTICFRGKLCAPPEQETPKRREIVNRLVASGYAESPLEAEFCLEICELWLVANILDLYDVTLCSPAGVRMRCPKALTAHGDAFDWWLWPLGGQKFGSGESCSYLYFFRHGNFRAKDAWARFPAINTEKGVVALAANSRTLFSGTSYGHGPDENIDTFIDEQVRPYLGWGLCFNPNDLPDHEEELFAAFGLPNSLEPDAETNNKKSTSAHKDVMSCIRQAYPYGKGAAVWETVEAKVGYSRRSIVRALRHHGQYEEWIKGEQVGKA
ncbi:hypothetical protein [Roseivivax marinus]|uniref:hypothetical protein n=1 Tax=Roseivivax marinus TaxID=1379903 RepID=UPI00273DB76A|nr:hypothetical protein [Roseivivax marinus]